MKLLSSLRKKSGELEDDRKAPVNHSGVKCVNLYYIHVISFALDTKF